MLTSHGYPCSVRMDGPCVRRMEAWTPGRPGGRSPMLEVISGSKRRQPAVARRQFPARRLHLVDIENLAGDSLPSLGQVREVQDLYTGCLGVGAFDQVVIASSHLTLLNAALGWPHARYRVRSGPNGADLELLDVLLCEDVAARFTHVVI